MVRMGFYLGFDFGTSSIKAAAINENGILQKTAIISVSMVSPRPGYFEVDIINQWLNGFLNVLHSLGIDIISQAEAICISSVCASFVPIDSSDRPLRNAIMYGIDTRAIEQINVLNHSVPDDMLSSVSFSGFTTHSIIPKIIWIRENEPEIYNKTKYFVESSNLITSFLTGEYAWDKPTAAGAHLLDLRTHSYPQYLFEYIDIDKDKFPPLRAPLEILGGVTKKASELTGLPHGIPVSVGACDINAEAFSCGSFDPGRLLIVFGSTISLLFTINKYVAIPGFIAGPSILDGTYRLGGATSSGGRYLEWLDKTLNIGNQWSSLDLYRPSELLMVPFLDGARLPYNDSHCRVLWYGMSNATEKTEYLKAAAESMGCEIYNLISILSQDLEIPACLNVSGGLSSNLEFSKIISNVTGFVLKRFKNTNASFGDALMALSSLKGVDQARLVLEKLERLSDEVEIIEPDFALFQEYASKRKAYMAAIEGIQKLITLDKE